MLDLLIVITVMASSITGYLSNVMIVGYPVITLIQIYLWVVAITRLLFSKKKENNLFVIETRLGSIGVVVLISLTISMLWSLCIGFTFAKTLSNACEFSLPIICFTLLQKSKFTTSDILNITSVSTLIAALFSVLVLTGRISGRLDPAYAYNINVNIVQGGFGVIGVILSIYTFMDKQNSIMAISLFIASVIILFCEQSRGSIIAAIACGFLYLLLSLNRQTKESTSFRRIGRASSLIILVVLGIAIIYNSNAYGFRDYIDISMRRINNTTMDEGNLTYRFTEIGSQLNMFSENIIFGAGWGAIGNKDIIIATNNIMRTHCSYTTVLAATGLSFGFCFYLFISKEMFILMKNRRMQVDNEGYLKLVLYLALLLLSVANAGFSKLPSLAIMLVVYSKHEFESGRKHKSLIYVRR